jgi:hypothetical protein
MINNCGVFSYAFRSLENDGVILQRVAEFLDLEDVLCCERVCITFLKVFCAGQDGLWTQLSLKEGVPLVKGPDRNRRKDFLTLRPITISGAMINRIIGQVWGEIPCISEVAFNKLYAEDPFEKGKSIKDTWVLVVLPAYIKRKAGPQTPFKLDDKGNLVKVPEDQVQNGTELVASLSLENIKMCASYSLKEEEKMCVVCDERSDPEVFEQCGVSSDRTRVYLMRKYIVNGSRNLAYANQKALVESYGFGVTPICIRAFFDVISIVEFGTCPDVFEPQQSYMRSSDRVQIQGRDYYAAMGSFKSDVGLEVCALPDLARPHIGVAPCIIADNLQ